MTQDGSTTDEQTAHTELPPMPNAALRCLDVLVGTWDVSGRGDRTNEAIHGQAIFAWMEGGFFLIQQVDLIQAGADIKAIEYIGYDAPSKSLRSHYFDNTGNIFENVWEVIDQTLTIWAGQIGASASFKSKISDDASSIMGRWEWPGGGYELCMAKIQ